MTQPNRFKSRILVAVALVAMLAAGVAVIVALLPRRTAPRQVVVPVDPNAGWEQAYARATSNLGTVEQATADRAAFVARYPRSPGTAGVLNQLGSLYLQQSKFAESVRAYGAAKELLAAGVGVGVKGAMAPSPGILDVNLAEAHRLAGDLARAEAVLAAVIARPLPAAVEPDAYVPQAFVGPLALADVRQDQRRAAEADALRAAVADRAIDLARAHPAAAEWVASYAASAYAKRIAARLEHKPPDAKAARALAEEFKRRAPGYRGVFGYDDMMASVTFAETGALGPAEGAAAAPAPAPAPAPDTQPADPTAP